LHPRRKEGGVRVRMRVRYGTEIVVVGPLVRGPVGAAGDRLEGATVVGGTVRVAVTIVIPPRASRVIFDVAVGVVLGLDQVVGSVEFGGTLQVRGLVASFQRLVLVLFGGVVGRLEEVGLIFAVHRLQVVHSGAEVARLVRRTRALEPIFQVVVGRTPL
jgi:hypothetical protein